ncbi:Argininosuccinate synthase ArgG [Methanonatronarchaeum thermophilum]|uniref:Argininosuccinate synthase n=1 Tax=Methanonatronarchaeum thermophilum TaxID=1927129 RepID=A0A1Y3GFX6_9EURY|nr:argininosuccinate synthase [Methanonatronarchaeum thermophilum]OUJ19104.1 Argininosuccinate synthase ArgG [Methanonatronarchaeum thermophilum]
MKKVILAYSGGLDTSVCVPLLEEKYGYDEVITATVDVGQPKEGLKEAKERAEQMDVKHYEIDAVQEFVENYLHPLIQANGSYEGYYLGHAIARPLIAKKVCEIAKKENADALAHGCTGKGNDQFRFETTYRIHSQPNTKIIAPVRELNMTRDEEKKYAKKRGLNVDFEEKKWSIDENIWSRSIEGGKLENPNYIPPEEIFQWTKNPEKAPDKPEILEITFKNGTPTKINGEKHNPVTLIQKLNKKVGKHGVGRVDMIEDRILGLKARENYEHPAATALITAHKDLEKLVLTRKQLKFKKTVDQEWAELAYNGLLYEPLYNSLQAFIKNTQKQMNGTVKLKLYKGSIQVVARESKNALYSKELVSFDDKTIDQKDAEGALKYHGYQSRLTKTRQNKK